MNDSIQDLPTSVRQIAEFSGTNLTSTVAELESEFTNLNKQQVVERLAAGLIDAGLVKAARTVKRAASQIDTVIHALGILSYLPAVLDEDEIVESLSLGAGSSDARRFDVETDRRVADFTFIEWRGNDNTRLQKIFKDFYRIAELKTVKAKELWLTNDAYALKYLNSDASIRSATHKHSNIRESLAANYPAVEKVSEYYRLHSADVKLKVLSGWYDT